MSTCGSLKVQALASGHVLLAGRAGELTSHCMLCTLRDQAFVDIG